MESLYHGMDRSAERCAVKSQLGEEDTTSIMGMATVGAMMMLHACAAMCLGYGHMFVRVREQYVLDKEVAIHQQGNR